MELTGRDNDNPLYSLAWEVELVLEQLVGVVMVGEVVAQESVDKAIAAADALEEAAIGAVAEEFAVVPRGVAEQPQGDAKGGMLNCTI